MRSEATVRRRRWMPGAMFSCGSALALFLLAAPLQAREHSDGLLESELNTIEVFRATSRSVVFITAKELRRDFFSRNVMEIPLGTGSGFIWDSRGHIVTNAHVVKGSTAVSITLADGSTHRATLVGVDPTKDVAVLRIEAPKNALRPVQLGKSRDLLVGQKVLAIGNPFGLDQTLTTGVVSALGREIKSMAGTAIQDVIQTDASINPGNSGGPLLDSHGRLIGINTAIYSPTGTSAGIGFAVPVATIARVVPQLIRYGRVKRAGLGVTLIPDDLARSWGVSGVIIRNVTRGSSAARAGLVGIRQDGWGRVTLGDVITGVNNKTIEEYSDLYDALETHKPGDVVTLQVRRGKRLVRVKIALQEID